MKVEIGESLMLSWLRHVKKCQSVQLNWKPSTASWELHNEQRIVNMMDSTANYFARNHQLNIFRNNQSHSQLLQQGEIDVLGLEIRDGRVANLYGVDIAFHESGLNYGSTVATVERVLKKMVRTAMIIHGYFNMTSGQIIFASPKIHRPVLEVLQASLALLQNCIKSLGFEFEFKLYANDSFRDEIYKPVISLSKSVADTSELFMRSIQMSNMFTESTRITKPSPERSSGRITSERPITESNSEMKIGVLVRSSIKKLIDSHLISDEELTILKNKKYCKEIFDVNYPVLKKVERGASLLEQRKINGYDRYWADTFTISGDKYLLCNDWYDRNRTRFVRWLDKFGTS